MNEDEIRRKIQIEEEERDRIKSEKEVKDNEEIRKGCLPAIIGLITAWLIYTYLIPAIIHIFK